MYGERKGAAYGLAGLVKGLGILFLKQLNIMSTLQEAIQDKKNYRHREGKSNQYAELLAIFKRLFQYYFTICCFRSSFCKSRHVTSLLLWRPILPGCMLTENTASVHLWRCAVHSAGLVFLVISWTLYSNLTVVGLFQFRWIILFCSRRTVRLWDALFDVGPSVWTVCGTRSAQSTALFRWWKSICKRGEMI